MRSIAFLFFTFASPSQTSKLFRETELVIQTITPKWKQSLSVIPPSLSDNRSFFCGGRKPVFTRAACTARFSTFCQAITHSSQRDDEDSKPRKDGESSAGENLWYSDTYLSAPSALTIPDVVEDPSEKDGHCFGTHDDVFASDEASIIHTEYSPRSLSAAAALPRGVIRERRRSDDPRRRFRTDDFDDRARRDFGRRDSDSRRGSDYRSQRSREWWPDAERGERAPAEKPRRTDRENLECTHFKYCSGCTLEHDLNNPPVAEDARRYFKQQGVANFVVEGGPQWSWRSRARLAVRGTPEQPIIGLFAEGSHDAIDIPECRIHHPSINAMTELIREGIIKYEVVPYDELTGEGELRYLQLVVESSTGAVQVSLVCNVRDYNAATRSPSLLKLTRFLTNRSKETSDGLLHSVWLNFQTSRGNKILGHRWHHLYGSTDLWEHLGGVDVCFTPSSFGQANLQLFDRMLSDIHAAVPMGSSVAEFYAGVGVIGLGVAQNCECTWVRCCEVTPGAQYAFNRSKSQLQPFVSRRISFVIGDAAANEKLMQDAATVIVDPPRRGLDRGLLWAIIQNRTVRTLIYVSCGWQAFTRDAALLTRNGWTISNAKGYVFFPGTDALETLAVFTRTRAPSFTETPRHLRDDDDDDDVMMYKPRR